METEGFIAVFTRALQLSLSWVRSIQSTPSHSIPPRSVLILPTRLLFGYPNGLFLPGFINFSCSHCLYFSEAVATVCHFLGNAFRIKAEIDFVLIKHNFEKVQSLVSSLTQLNDLCSNHWATAQSTVNNVSRYLHSSKLCINSRRDVTAIMQTERPMAVNMNRSSF
jgi:hypothetical protein